MRCKYAAGEKLLDQTWDRARHHDLLGTGAVLAAGERHRTGAQQILWVAGAVAADLIVCGSLGTGQHRDAQPASVADELACASRVSLLMECEAAGQAQGWRGSTSMPTPRAESPPGPPPDD